VKENPFVPPVVITAFKKVDEVVPFDRDISEVEKIALSYQDNFFSFEFVALDYTNPQKNQYAYKLEGFDRDWVHCGTRRYASYTNLDPGQYIFRVKGSNSDGAWNEEGVAVKITIHPPFWLTWWFIALLAGTLLGATVFFHKNRVRQKIRHALAIERARLLENERVRQQIAHDFHDELGNKLTNIFLFSEILHRKLEQVAPENIEYVNKIGWALKGLSGGIRDFVWILDPKQDSLQDVAIRLRDYAEEVFNGSGIDFQMPEPSNGLDGIKLSMDWRRHLTLLFKEAINNVRQHANCRQATMEFSANGERLAITLADDGQGFDPTNCAAGNGLRYMRKRAEKLAGEIEIVSNIGKGTMIRFGSRYPQNGA
jgi:signal transduction histidine kinase